MRNSLKLIGLATLAALSLTAMAIQDGVIIKRVAKVGDIAKFRLKADLDYQGAAITFKGLITEKVTKVTDDGQYTIDSSTSESKVTVAGNELDGGGNWQGSATTTYKSSGEIVSIISEQNDPNIYRMANLQSIQFPATPLNVGSSWDINIKKDDRGAVDAKGNFKIEAQEKVGDYDTYRVHGTIKESIDKDPASVDALYWVNIKDGTVVKMSGTWTNAPFPNVGAVTAKILMTRES